MNLNIDLKNLDINKIKENKHIIFIIVVILITAFLSKKIWEMQSAKLENIKSEIVHYKNVAVLAGEINSLFDALDKFKEVGWPTAESASIMEEVNKLASKHSVQIMSFNPGDFKSFESYYTLTMILNIKSDYFNLSRFLSELEELGSLTKVSILEIKPEGDTSQEEGPLIRGNLHIVAFILKR